VYKTFLSWRYIVARRTNWIGVIGITVGVAALILILSIMAGFLQESRKTLRGSLSDLVIQPSRLARPDGREVPRRPGPILEHVRADPRVEAACAHLTWGGMIAQGGRRSELGAHNLQDPVSAEKGFVQLVGIDPADEIATTGLRQALEREPLLTPLNPRVADSARPFAPPPDYAGDEPWAWVVVGEQVAANNLLYRGAVINVYTAVPDEESGRPLDSNRKFLVAGTFSTGENEIDAARIYLEREELADFLGKEEGAFSQVLVRLRDYARDGQAAKADFGRELYEAGLVRELDWDEVRTWEDYRRNLLGAIENEKTLLGIMLSLVLVVAGFTVFAILSMLVTEKRRDIGILTALGATPRGIMALYLMIGFWDALLGSILGALIGVFGALRIDGIEKWLSAAFGIQIFDRTVYLFSYIPSVVDPRGVALIVVGAFVCTLLFAVLPAWRAARLHPIDALRYE